MTEAFWFWLKAAWSKINDHWERFDKRSKEVLKTTHMQKKIPENDKLWFLLYPHTSDLVYHENAQQHEVVGLSKARSVKWVTLIATVVSVPANDRFVKNVVSGCLTEIWAPVGLSDNTMPLRRDGTLFLILTKHPSLYMLFLLHKTSCNRGGDIVHYTLHLPDMLSSGSEL